MIPGGELSGVCLEPMRTIAIRPQAMARRITIHCTRQSFDELGARVRHLTLLRKSGQVDYAASA